MKKKIIELSLICCAFVSGITGCSNKFNETGSWLVRPDSTLRPQPFNSDSLHVKITTSEVNLGLPNGSDSVFCLGKIPWTEADMLLEFTGIDSVYYATTIISAEVILRRGFYNLEPNGENVTSLKFAGYAIDSTWNSGTVSWDSVAILPRESVSMLDPINQGVDDSTISLQIDTGVVRRWANATQDTNYSNYGFILTPINMAGILSVYSSSYSGTGLEPSIMVVCMINGVPDTVTSTTSYATYVAKTSLTAPSQTIALQSGTGLHGEVGFDIGKVPKYSVINYAQLTVFSDTVDGKAYSSQSPDSLWVYYQTDPSTHLVSGNGAALSSEVGNKYTFAVTTIVQQMVNSGNYGFILTRYEDNSNVDSRFIYNESAADSLKPKLSIIYAPVVGKR